MKITERDPGLAGRVFSGSLSQQMANSARPSDLQATSDHPDPAALGAATRRAHPDFLQASHGLDERSLGIKRCP